MLRVSRSLVSLSAACGLGLVGLSASGASPADRQPTARTDAASALPLVITEVLYDSSLSVDSAGEWFELYNPTETDWDLGGLVVTDSTISAQNSFTINGPFVIKSGEYKVFARNANLGSDAYGATADYVWTTSGNFALANGRDTIIFRSGTDPVLSFVYNDDTLGGGWPLAAGASAQLDPSLSGSQRYQSAGSAWCTTQATMGSGPDRGTPGAAGEDCPAIDVDADGYWNEDDCDDEDAQTNVDVIEIPTNGIDNDCDGIVLFQVIDDPVGDSLFSIRNELSTLAIGWDETSLVFGFDYTLENNAIIWYFDLGIGGGETDFSSNRGYAGAFPSDVRTSETVEFMAASFGVEPLYLYKVVNGGSTDITSQADLSVRSSYLNDGSPGRGFVRIPWDALYGMGEGRVAEGAQLKIVGVIRANDNQGPADIAPNNGGATLNSFAVVDVDLGEMGSPDAGVFTDGDGDGFSPVEGDCNDEDPDINPDEDEVCNNLDDDCDGVRDEGVQLVFFLDADGDLHGDITKPISGCQLSPGLAEAGDDCDDHDGDNYPGNSEICDDSDNDCDETADEDAGPIWYADADEDSYRVDEGGVQACPGLQPPGTVEESALVDCDDSDPDVNPGAVELCNGYDDNCDEAVDGADSQDAALWYADGDGDGFGDPEDETRACQQPLGSVSDNTDCDDAHAEAHPGLDELCGDGLDNDCDATADEAGAPGAPTWYSDGDSDGYGDDGAPLVRCDQPEGYVLLGGDCQDGDPDVHPDAPEVCDEADQDCDATVDEEPTDGQLYHPDGDGDGYGATGVDVYACALPQGHLEDGSDCDDDDPAVNPAATEIPGNEVDEDCDGVAEGAPTPSPTPTPPEPTPTQATATLTATPTAPTATPTAATPTEGISETPTASPTPTEPGTPTASLPPTDPPTAPVTPTEAPPETSAPPATPTEAATAAPTDPSGSTPTAGEEPDGCGGCASGAGAGAPGWAGLLLLGLVVVGRRRR